MREQQSQRQKGKTMPSIYRENADGTMERTRVVPTASDPDRSKLTHALAKIATEETAKGHVVLGSPVDFTIHKITNKKITLGRPGSFDPKPLRGYFVNWIGGAHDEKSGPHKETTDE